MKRDSRNDEKNEKRKKLITLVKSGSLNFFNRKTEKRLSPMLNDHHADSPSFNFQANAFLLSMHGL